MTTTTTTTNRSADVLSLSAPATNPVSGDVPTNLTFYKAPIDGSGPYYYTFTPPAGVPDTNVRDDDQTVTIHDLRGIESEFSLDKQGFTTVSNVPSTETKFLSEEQIKSVYYSDTEAILRATIPGIEQVVIFDHTIRRTEKNAAIGPVMRVHIDQTAESGFDRVRLHLPEERVNEIIEKGIRTRIINVWRPINGPIRSYPLALADSSTVDEEDLLSVSHIYPDRLGATGGVKYNAEQKWWYWSGQTPDDVLLIKCYDTDTKVGGGAEGKRGRSPHTSFKHPGTLESANTRESIEVRCLIVG